MNNSTLPPTNPVIIIFAIIGLLAAAIFAYWGFKAADEFSDNASDYPYESQYMMDDNTDYSNDVLFDGSTSSSEPVSNQNQNNPDDVMRLDPTTSTNPYEGLEDRVGIPELMTTSGTVR